MKNYLKFIVAVFGITVAALTSVDANARQPTKGHCKSYGTCGTADDGAVIDGKYTSA